MLSDTLVTGLESYGIGPKIRSLRNDKKIGLVQLGKHTGLSAALLSKIERGQLFPTLPTLLRIALVFGVGLEHFFNDTRNHAHISVVRKMDRMRFPDRPEKKPPSYFFESLDFPVSDRKMQAFYAEFPPQSTPSDEHAHAGAEIIYVLSGKLVVSIEGNETILAEGDAMHFDPQFRHSYQQQGRAMSSAIVVVTA